MLHARDDYAHIQGQSGKIPVDEPVFLLRGKDRLAAKAVRFYALLAREARCHDIAMLSDKQARTMEKLPWTSKKLPDLPNPEGRPAPFGNWYWSTDGEEMWHGPHTSMEEAMVAAYEDDAPGAHLSQMAPMPLTFDMDMADVFLGRNEDQNFEGDAHIPDHAEWELNFLVEMLLRGWVDKHGLHREFLALGHLPGGKTCWRPRCDLALASITSTVYRVPVAVQYVSL